MTRDSPLSQGRPLRTSTAPTRPRLLTASSWCEEGPPLAATGHSGQHSGTGLGSHRPIPSQPCRSPRRLVSPLQDLCPCVCGMEETRPKSQPPSPSATVA